MSFKSFVKPAVLYVFEYLGFNKFCRRMSKTPIVVFWHGVSEKTDSIVEGESFSVELFVKQIDFLDRNFDIVSIDEFYKRYESGSFTNKEVVLTFDDGYKNNLEVAAPILKKRGLPFAVFVSAQNVTEQERFYILVPRLAIIGGELEEVEIPSMNYKRKLTSIAERIECAHEIEYKIKYFSHEKAKQVATELINYIGQDRYKSLCKSHINGELLTWHDVRKLISDYNCTIGSHCMDHCICHAKQSLDVVEWQLLESKNLIEKEIGKECKYFAYPNGDFTEETNKLVKKYYMMGFSTMTEPIVAGSSDTASIGRIGVPSSLIEFKFLLSKLAAR